MEDRDCAEFLRWALPRLHLRWAGFRKVRRQVCRRLARRLRELSLPDLESYRAYLAENEAEWELLDDCCRISISRFHRDRAVWEALSEQVLPVLARGARARRRAVLTAWSAGCASGEEPYSLTALWDLRLRRAFPNLTLRVIATDSDPLLLERARRGEYGASSLRDFPSAWRDAAFERTNGRFRVRPALREHLELRCSDLRGPLPDGPFDLVLCRNLAFTYFDEALQRETAKKLSGALVDGGALVLGRREALPADAGDFAPWLPQLGIHRRASRSPARRDTPVSEAHDGGARRSLRGVDADHRRQVDAESGLGPLCHAPAVTRSGRRRARSGSGAR